MKKATSDSKVKKTLVRNCELKVRSLTRPQVVPCSSNTTQKSAESFEKENVLSQPSLCSSGTLANYLADAKKSCPPPPSVEDLYAHKSSRNVKVTKKLNFHFNDKIYKNLIELNASVSEIRNKKERRPLSATLPSKKDVEPNIEDFYEDEKEIDSPPTIPILKPKLKQIKKVEKGQLHKLVSAFEDL